MVENAEQATATTMAVKDGRIAAIGTEGEARKVIDAGGRVVLPGFVDCHTHALFAGDRMHEHSLRLNGASYEEIARAGGGILATVNVVRAATSEELVMQTLPRLEALRTEGVTSIEIKSGYGLSIEAELKMLRAIRSLADYIDMDITVTYLGAHTVPADRDKDDYLREIVDETLPCVRAENLADCVDIFVEKIAFDLEDMRRVFNRARELDLPVRAHTDQLANLGGTKLAAELGALSCDHLEYANEADVRAMAESGTIAVLLPGAFYFLRETQLPPVSVLREHNVPIAIATDLNPGSSPVASLLTVIHLGANLFGLTPDEVLLGTTS
ncbi:MAG: imidazolonepropionase, partial [Gammaproteobacteria bacterium]